MKQLFLQSKFGMLLLLALPIAGSVMGSNSIKITYDGDQTSDEHQTAIFSDAVTAIQGSGLLELEVSNLADQSSFYTIELSQAMDISSDANIWASIKSDTPLQKLGVKLEDINGNSTTGNSSSDQFYLPGEALRFLNYSFSKGSNVQPSLLSEMETNNVDGTQIKKIVFFNNSGAEFSGKIWFDNMMLGSEDISNGAEITGSTCYLPFNGNRQFGNGLAGIAMDSNGKIGIAQNNELMISVTDLLGANSYQGVFIFENPLDVSNGNAVFNYKAKSDIPITLLFRFEDVNGKRVDLVESAMEITELMESYVFDVNNRLLSNPDFDATQVKEFQIRKLSADGVNGTVVIDDFNLGIPYFNVYANDYSGDISDATQTSNFDESVLATQTNGLLQLAITGIQDQASIYTVDFTKPLDISSDPNIRMVVKSDAILTKLGVKLIDADGNSTSGNSSSDKFYLPAQDKFLNHSFSAGSNGQASIQKELSAYNVDGTAIKKIVFFNNSGAEFTGNITIDYLQLSTEDTENGAMLTDTSFYAPFNGQRQFGNGIAGIGMDSNGKIGIAQDDELYISVNEQLGEQSYQTVIVFDKALDLSNGNSYIEFKMKADVEMEMLLRFEDFDGDRADLVGFVSTPSVNFSTLRFDVNHRFSSHPNFNADQIKEFQIRKISSGSVNGTVVIDDLHLGMRDQEAPTAPASILLEEVTDTTAIVRWGDAIDNFDYVAYHVYVNGEKVNVTTLNEYKLNDMEGEVDIDVYALDRAGNSSEPANIKHKFRDQSTSVSELTSSIRFYPNPVREILTLESSEAIQAIGVYNIVGKKVNCDVFINGTTAKIYMTQLNDGLFVVECINAKNTITRRIVKQ